MRSSYSRLRGRRVIGADGRRLGRLLDIVVAPSGTEMVATELIVVRTALGLTLSRLHASWARPVRLPAADLEHVGPDALRLRAQQ